MRGETERASATPRPMTGRQVLAMFIAFFGVIFAVNGYFLFSALSTHTGVVSVEPYRKGLAYNRRIAADARQTALGWSEDIAVDGTGEVTITIGDADRRAISRLSISAIMGRPSTSADDRLLHFTEHSAGTYRATTRDLPEGNWIISVEARLSPADAEPVYRARRRLWLKP